MSSNQKVKKAILESIKKYMEEGVHSHIIAEYTTKGGELGAMKALTVEDGASYLVENGYTECGFKCYTKKARVNKSIAYIVFETQRVESVLGVVDRDMGNIENDAKNRAAN